jgi:hypothetical protein
MSYILYVKKSFTFLTLTPFLKSVDIELSVLIFYILILNTKFVKFCLMVLLF